MAQANIRIVASFRLLHSLNTPEMLQPPFEWQVPEMPPSPLLASGKLRSNEPLSLADITDNGAVIHSVGQTLNALDNFDVQLEQLAAHIHAFRHRLSTRRDELVQFQAEHKTRSTLPSPAHELFPELLSKIFILHQEDTWASPSTTRDSFDVRNGPLVLTWVCRRWRNVALSTSQLWTNLRLFDKTYYSRPATALARSALLELWLDRARSVPVDLHLVESPLINAYKDTNNFSGFPRGTTLQTIRKCFPRCKSIVILGSFRKPAFLEMYFPADITLPLLQDLKVIDHSKGLQIDVEHEMVPINAPNLRGVHFNRLGFLPLVNGAKIQQLMLDVKSEMFAAHHILDLLACCTTLEILDLACAFHSPHSSIPLRRTILQSSLKTLKLSLFRKVDQDHSNEDIGTLFHCLQLPSLVNLSITSPGTELQATWDHTAFYDFLTHSGAELETLALSFQSGLIPCHLVTYLGMTPNLQDLHVHIRDQDADGIVIVEEMRSYPASYWPRRLPTLYLLPEPVKRLAHIASTQNFSYDTPHLGCFSCNRITPSIGPIALTL